jgi:hypothetical protein
MNMTPISPEEPKQTKSGLLVILAIILTLCLCVTVLAGMGGFSIWKINRIENLAATAAVQTMQAQATATHLADATERASFKFIDRFNDNNNDWLTENLDDEFMTGEITIANGVYNWNIDKTKQGFAWGDTISSGRLSLNDFDMYVDARLNKGSADKLCYGLRFRDSSESDSYYAFYICDEKDFEIAFLGGESNSWTILHSSTDSNAIHANEWNTLGVSARGDHYIFTINDWRVALLDDSRSKSGEVGVFIEVWKGQSGSVAFDNFTVQSR